MSRVFPSLALIEIHQQKSIYQTEQVFDLYAENNFYSRPETNFKRLWVQETKSEKNQNAVYLLNMYLDAAEDCRAFQMGKRGRSAFVVDKERLSQYPKQGQEMIKALVGCMAEVNTTPQRFSKAKNRAITIANNSLGSVQPKAYHLK